MEWGNIPAIIAGCCLLGVILILITKLNPNEIGNYTSALAIILIVADHLARKKKEKKK